MKIASFYIKEQTQKYKFEIWLFKSISLDPQKVSFWFLKKTPLSTFSRKNEITIPSLLSRRAKEPTYELNGCENNLSQRGVVTLGLLLLYKIDPELTL